MIYDAEDGKFDLLVVKSLTEISRCAATILELVRFFKKHGIEVFFESQNLSSTEERTMTLLEEMVKLDCCNRKENSKRQKQRVEAGIKEKKLRVGNRITGYNDVDGVLVPNKDAWMIKEGLELKG